MSKTAEYKLPPLSLLECDVQESAQDWYEDEENEKLIVNTINCHGFKSEVKAIHHGCSFTRYELSLEGKKKISSVLNLADNLAMVLEVENVRMLVPVPGKNTIGVEVPNKERTVVRFGSLIDALGAEMEMRIPIALGKDVYRQPMLFDLATSPHLLVGGMNGDEKTAFLDSLICSLLCTKTPDEVRLILVDTKVVELSVYNGVPHLLSSVITDAGTAFKALDFVVKGLERRIELLTSTRSRKIEEYNAKAAEKLPYIVVIIDDYADLILSAGKEFEYLIKRITAVARFCGIHLVLSTKRVSADVITGVIKSNIPTQIAFAVPNAINSRILIDQPGAEKLLGYGDMLYNNPMYRHPFRIQGTLIDSEIAEIVNFLKTQGEPDYLDESCFECVTKMKNSEKKDWTASKG